MAATRTLPARNVVRLLDPGVAIDPVEVVDVVRDNGAGAISTFMGTTRDHYEGKEVLRLEYEAFVPMAQQELERIVAEARAKWSLCHVAVVHRIGVVAAGEASVLIAVSSVHRREAMHAVEFLIDTLKARVPIWKKEIYTDGSEWKGEHHHTCS